MELDLNHPGEFTLASVQRLIANLRAGDDRIVVRRDGIVSANPAPGGRIAFAIVLDPRTAGNPAGRARRVYACLRNNWPVARDVYL